jgi:uncharacterized protein YjeT (DUF2065 family)
MDDLATTLGQSIGLALGLAIALEGMLYALFPGAMRRLIAHALDQPENSLRIGGLIAAICGVGLVWLLKTS